MKTDNKSELPNSEEIFVFSGLLLDQNEPKFNQPRGNQIQDVKSPMLQTSIFTEYEYSNKTKCCNLCGKIFVSIEAFENHMNSVHNEFEMQIHKSDETKENVKNVNENNLLWVTKYENEVPIGEMCNKSFPNKHVSNFHTSGVHEGKNINHSSTDFISSEKEIEEKIDPLNVPQVIVTEKPIEPDTIENVTKIVDYEKNVCKICNKKFKNENVLNFHISRVHEGKKYKCHQCDKICQSSSSLNDHVNQAHENELQKCNECNKIFKSVFFKQHNCIKTDTGLPEITESDDKSLIPKLSDALEISTEVVDEKDKHIPLQILNKLDGKKCTVCK